MKSSVSIDPDTGTAILSVTSENEGEDLSLALLDTSDSFTVQLVYLLDKEGTSSCGNQLPPTDFSKSNPASDSQSSQQN